MRTFLFIVIAFVSCFFALPALADMPVPTQPSGSGSTSTTCPPGRQCLENPLTGGLTVTSVIGLVIKAALGIIGSVTLLMLVWGGFLWLTSAGNEERVQHGTQTMLWAVIGLAVVFGSYMFLTTYVSFLTRGP